MGEHLKQDGQGVVLSLVAKPNSKIEGIKITPESCVVRVRTPPVDGKANKRIVQLLSVAFKVSKSQIELDKGVTGKSKRFLFRHCSLEEMVSRWTETVEISC